MRVVTECGGPVIACNRTLAKGSRFIPAGQRVLPPGRGIQVWIFFYIFYAYIGTGFPVGMFDPFSVGAGFKLRFTVHDFHFILMCTVFTLFILYNCKKSLIVIRHQYVKLCGYMFIYLLRYLIRISLIRHIGFGTVKRRIAFIGFDIPVIIYRVGNGMGMVAPGRGSAADSFCSVTECRCFHTVCNSSNTKSSGSFTGCHSFFPKSSGSRTTGNSTAAEGSCHSACCFGSNTECCCLASACDRAYTKGRSLIIAGQSILPPGSRVQEHVIIYNPFTDFPAGFPGVNNNPVSIIIFGELGHAIFDFNLVFVF